MTKRIADDIGQAEVIALVRDWLAYQSNLIDAHDAQARNAVMDAHMPVIEQLDEAAKEKPDLCWQFILAVLNQVESPLVLANLAAGPLEDLLAKHGPQIIQRVEELAYRDDRFRELLAPVWQNEMSENIWARVCAAAQKDRPKR